MIPAAHMLGHPRRWRGLYVATCACGWDMYGLSLEGDSDELASP